MDPKMKHHRLDIDCGRRLKIIGLEHIVVVKAPNSHEATATKVLSIKFRSATPMRNYHRTSSSKIVAWTFGAFVFML